MRHARSAAHGEANSLEIAASVPSLPGYTSRLTVSVEHAGSECYTIERENLGPIDKVHAMYKIISEYSQNFNPFSRLVGKRVCSKIGVKTIVRLGQNFCTAHHGDTGVGIP